MFAATEQITDSTISAALTAPLMVLGVIFILCLIYGIVLWQRGTPPDLPPDSDFNRARHYDNKDS